MLNLSMPRNSFSALAASAAVNNAQPLVVLRAHSKADPGYERVVLSVSHRGESRRNKDIVFSAIASMFNGKATPVPNTWLSYNQTPLTEDLVGLVASNKQVIAYSPESSKNFRAISSNMFMDEEKNFWTLKETDGGKLWVKTTAYDDESVLTELLSSLSSAVNSRYEYDRNFPDVEFVENIQGGDYVAYVSNNSNQKGDSVDGFATGFVASTVMNEKGGLQNEVVVLGFNKQNYEVIDRNMLLSVCSSDDFKSVFEVKADNNTSTTFESTASGMRSNVSLEDIISYYRVLFSRNAEYFKGFEQRIREKFYG